MPTQVLGKNCGIFWQRKHEEDLESPVTPRTAASRGLGLGNQERPEVCLLSKQMTVFLRALLGLFGKQGGACNISAGALPPAPTAACVASSLAAPGDVFDRGLQYDQLLTFSLYSADSPTLLCPGLQILTAC